MGSMAQVALLGTGEFATPALRALVDHGYTVTVAISQPDRPAGRGRQVQPTAVRAAAETLGIPHVQAEDVNALDFAATFGGAQIGVVAAFGQKLGGALLDALPRGCINLHGSLLPKYRGAAPYQWAILSGETETGVTLFQIDEKWDNGPIWGKATTPIGPYERAGELHDRLADLGAELLVDVLPGVLDGTATPQPQDAAQASRAPKLKRADGAIDWEQPAEIVVRQIRGLWPWPAAVTDYCPRRGKSERLIVARAEVADPIVHTRGAKNQGVVADDGSIHTGLGSVRLIEVKPAGGKLMSYSAFANGRHVEPGDRFVTPELA